MSCKKWIVGFVLIVIGLLMTIIVLNYTLDIYNYWKAGDEKVAFEVNVHPRILKMKHISENPDLYQGFILGGSKAGVLNAKLISEYEGKNFYNLSVPGGCFRDYEAYTNYLIENTSVQKIIIHLGSIEVLNFAQDELPALLTESKMDDIKEKIQFLIVNPAQMIRDIIEPKYYDAETGERNYEKDYKEIAEIGDSYYLETGVASEYNKLLDIIFHEVKSMPAHIDNVESLRRIVATCNANNIELEVVIGSTFISELYKFEGDEYWSYLREIAAIVDYWDFSGFNNVNRNPFNFVNQAHYNEKVANKMVNIMYGKEIVEGFGEHVDSTNIEVYINRRASKFFEMQKVFEETGTIEMFDRTHESYMK